MVRVGQKASDAKAARKRKLKISDANKPRPAITSKFINVFPFPFGDSERAKHGHHEPFPVGHARRVGAWRNLGGIVKGRR